MGALEERAGVLRKHQKLICKGKVLEAERPIAEQCRGKAGRATVMLMASVGGGGAPPPPPTAGQAALAASRGQSRQARGGARERHPSGPRPSSRVRRRRSRPSSLVVQDGHRRTPKRLPRRHPGRGLGPRCVPRPVPRPDRRRRNEHHRRATRLSPTPPPTRYFCPTVSDTRVIHTLRPILPAGDAARAVDLHGNRLTRVPSSVRALSSLTRLRASDNALALDGVPWSALASLGTLTVLHLDGNRLTGGLPPRWAP